MPNKYILVSQLYARTPFQNGQLRFIIKPRSLDAPVNTSKAFAVKAVAAAPGQYIDFEYEAEHVYALGMYVLAIGNNEVVNIGCVPLHLDEEVREKKEYLKGIVEQNGYVIMSLRDKPFEEDKAHQKGSLLESK